MFDLIWARPYGVWKHFQRDMLFTYVSNWITEHWLIPSYLKGRINMLPFNWGASDQQVVLPGIAKKRLNKWALRNTYTDVIELAWGPYWENIGRILFFSKFMDLPAGEVHKLGKKERVRTEQASSKFLLSWLYFEFPDGKAHLIGETHPLLI